MTKPTTEELKDLLGKVTQGGWRVHDGYSTSLEVITDSESVCDVFRDDGNSHDATLIALAPTLAAEVVRLRELVVELEGDIDDMHYQASMNS